MQTDCMHTRHSSQNHKDRHANEDRERENDTNPQKQFPTPCGKMDSAAYSTFLIDEHLRVIRIISTDIMKDCLLE